MQAIASGNSIAKPLFPQAVPPPIPAPKPISMAAPPPKPPLPAGIPQEQRDMIEKVAQFCASKGVETLKALRDKEESKKLMPFLYDGAPGHTDFLAALKRHVGIAGPSAPEKQQPMPPNNSSNERRSRFGPK